MSGCSGLRGRIGTDDKDEGQTIPRSSLETHSGRLFTLEWSCGGVEKEMFCEQGTRPVAREDGWGRANLRARAEQHD